MRHLQLVANPTCIQKLMAGERERGRSGALARAWQRLGDARLTAKLTICADLFTHLFISTLVAISIETRDKQNNIF
jgi:hypothetical protein